MKEKSKDSEKATELRQIRRELKKALPGQGVISIVKPNSKEIHFHRYGWPILLEEEQLNLFTHYDVDYEHRSFNDLTLIGITIKGYLK